MLEHDSAGLTLDRYRHLYGSGVEAVGVAINALFTRDCDQTWSFEVSELRFSLVEPRGLEPLTLPCKGSALPTELRPLFVTGYVIRRWIAGHMPDIGSASEPHDDGRHSDRGQWQCEPHRTS